MEDDFVKFGRAVSCPIRLELLRALGDDGLTLTEAAYSVGVMLRPLRGLCMTASSGVSAFTCGMMRSPWI
jgi:hypothetical protein